MTSKVRSARYTILKLAIIEKYHSQQNFANYLGITKAMLQSRLRGVTGWSEEEYQQNEEWIKEEKTMFEQPEEANAETGEEPEGESENPNSTGLGQTKGIASQEGEAEAEPSGEENLPDDNLKGENPGNEGESEIVMP
jgi:hypothetical protein